jgi:hypothetical protein
MLPLMLIVRLWLVIALLMPIAYLSTADEKIASAKKPKKKKDIRDYTDADLEKLYDEWEKDEEPLETDELPEHLRPSAPIDMSQLDPSNPEKLLLASKKGKTLMMFATVSGNPTRQESEQITGLWQTSLFNNHVEVQRFMIEDNRVIFTFKDGAQGWEAKEFLTKQERCAEVTVEGKSFPGIGAQQALKEKDLHATSKDKVKTEL